MRIVQAPVYQIQRPARPPQTPVPDGRLGPRADPQPTAFTTRGTERSGVRATDIDTAEVIAEARAITTHPRHALAVQTFSQIAGYDGEPNIIDVYA